MYMFKVKKSFAGLGLFATEPIKKGTQIIEYVGNRLTEKQAIARGGEYLFEVSKNVTIDGTPRHNTARYINHSCKPNCEAENKRGRIFISAIKNIELGDELCYNYGTDFKREILKNKKGGCKCSYCQSKRLSVESADTILS